MSGYVGEIRLYAGSILPANWLACDGGALSISAFTDLYAVIGSIYGGDDSTTFNVPDFRGRVAIGPSTNNGGDTYLLGNTGGVESVQLTTQNLPAHSHPFDCSVEAGTASDPTGNLLAQTPAGSMVYRASKPSALMNSAAVASSGGGTAHENRQPYLALNYMIAFADTDVGPYLGEIRIFPYPAVPQGWVACAGQILSTTGNSSLFAVLGTTYGGNGSTDFALPDLQTACAIGTGQGTGLNYSYALGASGGSANVTLLATENAVHNHTMLCVSAFSGTATSSEPAATEALAKSAVNAYGPATTTAAMDPTAIGNSPPTGTEPHINMMPSLGLCFAINISG